MYSSTVRNCPAISQFPSSRAEGYDVARVMSAFAGRRLAMGAGAGADCPLEALVSGFPPIVVRQPRSYDIVDDPVRVCGIGTGFEGQIAARVRDGHGTQLVRASVHAGGTGTWGNYEAALGVGVPS